MALCIAVSVHLLALLNFIGIDVFHFFDYLSVSQAQIYISVFGNINVYGVYAVITAAISAVLYVTCNGRRERVVYLIFSLFCIIGVIVSNSDTAGIGFLTAMLLVLFLALRSYEALRNYLFIILLTLVSGRIIGCGRFLNLTYGRTVESVFSPLLYSNKVFIFIVALVAVIVLMDKYSEKIKCALNEYMLKKLNYIYAVILGIVIVCLACVLIYYNLICKNAPQWADNVFVINESWGSYRGYIWKNLIDGYKNMPFIYKLFGTGEATVSSVLSDYSSIHWNLLNGGVADNAHNIVLQLLVTTGFAGAVSYLVLIVYFMRRVLAVYKDFGNKDGGAVYFLAFGIAGAACFVQGLFCLLETITFPIFICILAIMNTYGKRK
jgi:hypothetical protein